MEPKKSRLSSLPILNKDRGESATMELDPKALIKTGWLHVIFDLKSLFAGCHSVESKRVCVHLTNLFSKVNSYSFSIYKV